MYPLREPCESTPEPLMFRKSGQHGALVFRALGRSPAWWRARSKRALRGANGRRLGLLRRGACRRAAAQDRASAALGRRGRRGGGGRRALRGRGPMLA
eukprot:scaffold84189_cov67-Phaeocystis_antarctica.AAC.1